MLRFYIIFRGEDVKMPDTSINQLDLLKHVYENFKNRVDLFWKSYYKLLLYHLTIPVLPFFAFKYIEKNHSDLISILVIVGVVIIFLGLWGLVSSIQYLVGEENRIYTIHKVYKKNLGKLDSEFEFETKTHDETKRIHTGLIMISKMAHLVLVFSFVMLMGLTMIGPFSEPFKWYIIGISALIIFFIFLYIQFQVISKSKRKE